VVVSRVMGRLFLRQGYRILLPDSRAHGESGGSVATYGLREGDDIHRWVDWLYGKGATCVDGFGESMGADLVLESFAPSLGFARSLPNPLSPISAALPTIGKAISWELVTSVWSALSEERSDFSPQNWVSCTPVGAMA